MVRWYDWYGQAARNSTTHGTVYKSYKRPTWQLQSLFHAERKPRVRIWPFMVLQILSNPFSLLRRTPKFIQIPFTSCDVSARHGWAVQGEQCLSTAQTNTPRHSMVQVTGSTDIVSTDVMYEQMRSNENKERSKNIRIMDICQVKQLGRQCKELNTLWTRLSHKICFTSSMFFQFFSRPVFRNVS